MTVSSTTKKVTASGNGSATVFSFSPFTVFLDTDLLVVKVDAAGSETTLVKGTGAANYSVTLTNPTSLPSTGSVTYPASGATRLANGESIVMKRNLSLLQDIDLLNQGGYFPDVLEGGLDKGVMISLQQQDDIDRSLKGPITDTVSVEIPSQSDRASKFLAFDVTGVPITSSGSAGGVAVSTFMETVLDDTTAAAARTTLGAASTDAASVTAAGIVELATTVETTTGTDTARAVTPDGLHDMSSLAGAAWFLDEDAMGSDSATKVSSQQSVKAYVTSSVAAAPQNRVLLLNNEWSSGTPSSVTFEDADGMNWGTYEYFDIDFSGYISASCRIICTMSQGGVYETGASDYHCANTGSQYTNAFDNASPGIDIPNISNQIYKGGSQYNEMFHLKASLYSGLSDGTNIDGPYIHWSLAGSKTTSGNRAHANGSGALRNLVATAIDGIKFELNTGTMNNGWLRVWGIK